MSAPDHMTPDEINDVVVRATKAATQEVAARNRRRLRVESLLIGTVVACAVAIPTTLVLARESASVQRRHSAELCRVQADARPQGNARAFNQVAFFGLLEDALHPRARQTAAARQRIQAFARAELAHINALANGKADGQPDWRKYTATATGNELPAKITGFAQLASTVRPVPLLNCRHVLR
jgi:hypothetical protein